MRRAVDTNILVRLITRDDDLQSRKVKALVESGGLVVSPTVLLETEWVLRSAFRYERAAIELSLLALLDLPGLDFIDRPGIEHAFHHYRGGMDFADALHLCAAVGCDEFVTFDQRMVRLAAKTDRPTIPVRLA